MNGQTGPKFTPTEREAVMARVAEMDRRGYTQWEIARAIGDISQVSICKYLQRIRAEYNSRRHASVEANREEKRAQYAEIRKVAWEQYEKCIEGEVTMTDEYEMVKSPKVVMPDHVRATFPGRKKGEPAPKNHEELEMKLRRTIIRSSSKRAEAAQFLAIIMKCLDAEREMDGLISKMVAIVPHQPTLDWDALLRRPVSPSFPQEDGAPQAAIADRPNELMDAVEQKLAELESMPPLVPEDPPSSSGNGQQAH